MRINSKDLLIMYSNFTIDERQAPITLKRDDLVLSDALDQNRTVMEAKMNQSEMNRS